MNCLPRILLAGNPNVGKTTVFNALTGLKQHTGNWSGKTVGLAFGTCTHRGQSYEIWDLPGTYSMISNSPEEEIARDAICFQEAKCTLIVADATCLTRNLNLVLQILEITPHAALCVNLMDEAKRKHITVDIDALSRRLGIPVIGISAEKSHDIRRLKEFIAALCSDDRIIKSKPPLVRYPSEIEVSVSALETAMSDIPFVRFSKRFTALKLLDNTESATVLLNDLSCTKDQKNNLFTLAKQEQARLYAIGLPPVAVRDEIVGRIVHTAQTLHTQCTHAPTLSDSVPISRADQILTSRRWGIFIMIGFLGVLLWITIYGANIPSQVLMQGFQYLAVPVEAVLTAANLPPFWIRLLTDGVYQTTAWVTAVMLPPMLIFFPLFTLLEDLGFLPRIAFNLDPCFQSAHSCGHQALTMCMGLGCNAVGVTGCRIIASRRQRITAMLTNCFMPCNGRFFMLITLSSVFLGSLFSSGMQSVISAFFLTVLLILGVLITLGVTRLLNQSLKKEASIPFSLELPPFRKPQLLKILTHAFVHRTLHILSRALRVSAPAGAIIWIMANTDCNGQSLLLLCSDFFDPFARLMGLDGVILMAFILALPANEIVLPIILMGYLSSGQMLDAADFQDLHRLLTDHGWTILTAVNTMLFSLLHFPCATTLWTIQKESGSVRTMLLGFAIPTAVACGVCMLTHLVWLILT